MSGVSGKPTFRFRIEPARPGDEKAVCDLIHALAKYERAPENCVATPEMVRRQLFGQSPVAHAVLARSGDRVVGFALYFLSFSTWLCRPGMHLEDLFVIPEFREKGVGRALLLYLARMCMKNGYGRMEWTCLEWNELAKKQYRKMGAAPLEEWRTWRLTGKELEAFADNEMPKALEEDTPPIKPARLLQSKPVIVYTDGGCRPNPGPGAWAAVLIHGDKIRELTGSETSTTNNRMEMLAAINALEALKRPCRVEMHTDSEYLKNGITKWIHAWKKKKWMRGDKPVKNVDLWMRLEEALRKHEIEWTWVRGHSGDLYNERCDQLCRETLDAMLEE